MVHFQLPSRVYFSTLKTNFLFIIVKNKVNHFEKKKKKNVEKSTLLICMRNLHLRIVWI